jgi:hypothetical protein
VNTNIVAAQTQSTNFVTENQRRASQATITILEGGTEKELSHGTKVVLVAEDKYRDMTAIKLNGLCAGSRSLQG